MKRILAVALVGALCVGGFAGSALAEAGPVAYPSTQMVNVDGTQVSFEMYALKDANGNMTNYIKARDLALALNGTAAQFDVDWNGAVNLIPGAAYRSNGSENQTPYSGERTYSVPATATNVNSVASDLSAIVLTDDSGGGYTYYQLRDLGRHLNFEVGWTAEEGITVRTGSEEAAPTVPEEPPEDTSAGYDDHGWYIDRTILSKKLPDGVALTYYVNVKSGKFHKPGCRTIKNGTEEEYWYETGAGREAVVGSGYDPCGVCHP